MPGFFGVCWGSSAVRGQWIEYGASTDPDRQAEIQAEVASLREGL